MSVNLDRTISNSSKRVQVPDLLSTSSPINHNNELEAPEEFQQPNLDLSPFTPFSPPSSSFPPSQQTIIIIGKSKPSAVLRIERDWSLGSEIVRFWDGWNSELEGKLRPIEYQEFMNGINEILSEAFDPKQSIFDNLLGVLTLYVSTLVIKSHYTKKMQQFSNFIRQQNVMIFNPVGLNILDPAPNAFLFLEIEYY